MLTLLKRSPNTPISEPPTINPIAKTSNNNIHSSELTASKDIPRAGPAIFVRCKRTYG